MNKRMARGEGKAGCILWSLLLFSVAFAAYKVIPVQLDKMQLEDHMEELAMMQVTSQQDEEFFVKAIMRRARELRLPLKEENVQVQKSPKRVVMDAKYTVVLDLLVTEYPMEVDIHIDRTIFLN